MFGLHVNRVYASGKNATIAAHIASAVELAEKKDFKIRAVAMFISDTKSPVIRVSKAETEELKTYLAETGIHAYAHGSYRDAPWTGNPQAAAFIVKELVVCKSAGISGLVIHLPSEHPPAANNINKIGTAVTADTPVDGKKTVIDGKAAIDGKATSDTKTGDPGKVPGVVKKKVADMTATERVVRFLPRCWSRTGVRLYLEMVAASPARMAFATPEAICELFKQIRKQGDPELRRTGLCIDTAHLWSGGIDLSSYASARDWLDRLESVAGAIPPDKIMIHLNDSQHELGDGRDKHETLLRGKMWGAYREAPAKSGLAAFVEYAIAHETPVILERSSSGDILSDYAVLASLGACRN